MENQNISENNERDRRIPESEGSPKAAPLQRVRGSLYVTKKSLITAAVLTAALLVTVLFSHRLFLQAESGGLLLAAAVACSLLAGLFTAVGVRMSNRTAKIINPIIFFLMPVASMCMAECINGKFIYDFSYVSFFCNYIVYLLLYAVIMVFSGSFKMPIVIMTPIIFLFAVVCSVVLTFRGTPLVPMDIVLSLIHI